MQLSKTGVSSSSHAARLYELHAPALFAYLRQRTVSREDAEDVLVEIFVAAVEHGELTRLSEQEQVAWLWRVARNKAVDAYRRSHVRQSLDLAVFADMLYEDDAHAPEQVSLQREEHAHLHAHLEKLSPIQRRAIQLRFANNLRCSEIATILGKREGAVRVMLSRTLNYLRGAYAKDQGETHS